MLGILQQTEEFSSHTIHQITQILSSKIEKKHEKYQNLEVIRKF